jgi:3-phosphoglycerate kinase
MQSYYSITFIPLLSELKDATLLMKDGDIIMLENLRVDDGEKNNDVEFSKKIALCGNIYINDAFAVSHREHASIVGVPKLLPSYAGPLLSREIESLSIAFNPPHPFVFILAGAKFETKLPLVMKFIELADHVVLAGALANDIYREKGYEVGTSMVSKARTDIGKIAKNIKVFVPRDVVVQSDQGVMTKNIDEVSSDECIMDSGASSIAGMADIMSGAKLVLWNGPLGNYEKGFSAGTKQMAQEIVDSGAKSLVGGGDTVAAIRSMGLLDKFSFVSTGGGAMLDFLSKGTLPGVEALKK